MELLRCFRAAAAKLDIRLDVVACDLRPDRSAACQEADESFRVPACEDQVTYGDAILDICRDRDISLVVPTIDPELLPLANLRNRLAEIGTAIAISASALVEVARDKLKTAQFLSAQGIPAPRTASPEQVAETAGDWQWPLLAKPRHGSSGRAVCVLPDVDALQALPCNESFVVQERLHPPEFTVNMFFDRSGALRCAIPHERLQVRAGEVEKGVTRRVPDLEDIARKLSASLPGPRGALCYQAMRTPSGTFSVIEINARFGGGYPLADRAGATFAQWLLEECLGEPVRFRDDWKENVMMLRYDSALFVSE